MSAVGRGDAAAARLRAYADLLGWTLVPLGPETERAVVLGGRPPTARIDALRRARPDLALWTAADLDAMDLAEPVRAAILREDADWLAALGTLRAEVAVPALSAPGRALSCPFALRIDEADLTGARIARADLKGARIRLADARVEGFLAGSLAEPDLTGLRAVGTLDRLRVEGGTWRGVDLSGARARSCAWSGADLQGTRWEDAELWGVSFEACDLRDLRLDRARHENLELVGCDLRGARLVVGGSTSVLDCDLRGADLRGSLLAGAWLGESRLEDADLDGVPLLGVGFEDGPSDVSLPRPPCERTSIAGRASGLRVELEVRWGDTDHPILAVTFRKGGLHRSLTSEPGAMGRLVEAVRSWGLAPEWDEVRVSGRAPPDAGRRYWSDLLNFSGPTPGAESARGASASAEDVLERARRARDDVDAWDVLIDATVEQEGPFPSVLRRVLGGERPTARAVGLPVHRHLDYGFHEPGGRALPWLREIQVRSSSIPLRDTRALAQHPAAALVNELVLRDVPREGERLLALPARRLILGAHASIASCEALEQPNPHVVELSMAGLHRTWSELGAGVAPRFPSLRALYVHGWRSAGLAGLSVDRLYLMIHDLPGLDLAGCAAAEIHLLAYREPLDARALRVLEAGPRVLRTDGTPTPETRAALDARGVRLEPLEWPMWLIRSA